MTVVLDDDDTTDACDDDDDGKKGKKGPPIAIFLGVAAGVVVVFAIGFRVYRKRTGRTPPGQTDVAGGAVL